MNLFTKRFGLVLAGVVGVGAIASLATAASFALFTATGPTQNNTFAAGTVSLPTSLSSGSVTLNLSNMAPGDSAQGSYQLTYGGTLPAFLGVEVTTSTTTSTDLGLALTVADANQNSGWCVIGQNGGVAPSYCTTPTVSTVTGNTYVVPVQFYSAASDIYLLPGSSSLGDNQLCTTNTGDGSGLNACPATLPGNAVQTLGDIAGEGQTVNLQLYVNLPLGTDNTFQGTNSTVTLTLVAVQAPNNISSCTIDSNAATCPTAWS
ncbi:MAG: TasA family protein [Candidatus Dormiibacterota bacterium]